MKVLHSGTLDTKAGGPAMSTYLTLRGLNSEGAKAAIIMPELQPGSSLRGNDVPILYTQDPIESRFSYIRNFKSVVRKAGPFDLYHAQGIWQYPTYALVDEAKRAGKPYLITPRGMLYPQDIAKSSTFLKRVSLKWRLLRDLNHAACVHVTCMDEMRHCRDLGITSPIAVVPNPVEIMDYPEQKKDNVFRVGYLGRISPRKHIECLLYAFAYLGKKLENAELLIIGSGDNEYEAFLRKEAERLKLKNIRFKGFLTGKEKDGAIASCSVLAMPSEFENLGNVILEGLVRGIPCIATKGAPWEELATHHCGWWVDYAQETITQAIEEASRMSEKDLAAMGQRGKRLMQENYSVEIIARKMKNLYDWILGHAPSPPYVFMD